MRELAIAVASEHQPLMWTGVPVSVADTNRRDYMAWYSEDARSGRAAGGELDSAGNWTGAQVSS